jgi:hypothetical protein
MTTDYLESKRKELEEATKDLKEFSRQQQDHIARHPNQDTGFPTKGYALRSYRWSEDIAGRWDKAMMAMDIPAMMRISKEMDDKVADMADLLGIERK